MGQPTRLMADQHFCQLFRAARTEQGSMSVAEAINLRLHRRHHMRMTMAKAGHRRAARAINHVMPGGIPQPNPLAGDGNGRVLQ